MNNDMQTFLLTTLEVMTGTFIFLIGCGVLVVMVIYVIDVSQTKQAIRRNYPVVGRFRYFFEHLGEFFHQYFFSMDREELPFQSCATFMGISRRKEYR